MFALGVLDTAVFGYELFCVPVVVAYDYFYAFNNLGHDARQTCVNVWSLVCRDVDGEPHQSAIFSSLADPSIFIGCPPVRLMRL
jgi:hypothetical protein